MLTAMAALPFMIVVGIGVDFSRSDNRETDLETALDSASLAAAATPRKTQDEREQIAKDIFAVNFDGGNNPPIPSVSFSDYEVTVTASYDVDTAFMRLAGHNQVTVNASSTAITEDIQPACVLVLNETEYESAFIDSNAQLNATTCNMHVNSDNNSALGAYSNSQINTHKTCVVGGYAGSDLNYNPNPITNCEKLDDPLASLPAPATGGCDENDMEIDDQTLTLNEGIYCGGILIKNNSNVTFNSGIYVIKNGEFKVDSNSSIQGVGVMFYFTGNNATIFFDSNSNVDLVAPTEGIYEGVVFFEDRNAQEFNLHKVYSNNVSQITGAVYLSRGVLEIDSNTTFGGGSAWTTIVVNKLRMLSNIILEVNTDYEATDVIPPKMISAWTARLLR